MNNRMFKCNDCENVFVPDVVTHPLFCPKIFRNKTICHSNDLTELKPLKASRYNEAYTDRLFREGQAQ